MRMKNNKKQAAIGFIFITMLIDITGWGIIIPVIPKLISELIHGDISEAAKYGGCLCHNAVYLCTINRKS
jgi:DHA1 family tetracycline resistance protein-like MFS transporter